MTTNETPIPTLTEIAESIEGRANHASRNSHGGPGVEMSYGFLMEVASYVRLAEVELNRERGLSIQFIPEVIRDQANDEDESLEGIDDQTLRMAAEDVLDTGCLNDAILTVHDEIMDRARYLHGLER